MYQNTRGVQVRDFLEANEARLKDKHFLYVVSTNLEEDTYLRRRNTRGSKDGINVKIGMSQSGVTARLKSYTHMSSNFDQRFPGLRGWEFCTICPFFAIFSAFTKISQVPSFQAHYSHVKTVFRQNPKNAPKSQNTPSTNPYQNETQFSPLSLKSRTSRHPDHPKV